MTDLNKQIREKLESLRGEAVAQLFDNAEANTEATRGRKNSVMELLEGEHTNDPIIELLNADSDLYTVLEKALSFIGLEIEGVEWSSKALSALEGHKLRKEQREEAEREARRQRARENRQRRKQAQEEEEELAESLRALVEINRDRIEAHQEESLKKESSIFTVNY